MSIGSGGIGGLSAMSAGTRGVLPYGEVLVDSIPGASMTGAFGMTGGGMVRIVIAREGPAGVVVVGGTRIDRRRPRIRSRRKGIPGYASIGTSRLGSPTRLPSPKNVNISMACDSAPMRAVRAMRTIFVPTRAGAEESMGEVREGAGRGTTNRFSSATDRLRRQPVCPILPRPRNPQGQRV